MLFVPLLLFLNSIVSYIFNKWISAQGLFMLSLITLIVTILITLSLLRLHFILDTYWFIDLGRIFFVYNYIDLHFILVYDNLALIMTLVVSVLTLFAIYFGLEYMYREAFTNRLLYLLNAFSTSVIFLFFVYDFLLLLIIWELIGLFSLLLVNFYSTRIYTIKAALKTFIFSRLSDFFLFSIFIIFMFIFGSGDFSVIFTQSPFMLFYSIFFFNYSLNILNLVSLLTVVAAGIKAAQFLFYVWLPDAMEAPTPASALIHSSTLVIMGIFLIIRFQIIFEFSYIGNYTLISLGGITIAAGAVSASFQNDIKKLVAYSTVSQMGYLFCGCGFVSHNEVLFYLIVHAINKAFLFILVGYVVHFFYGNTDLRFMGSILGYNKIVSCLLMFISLNLTGLPLTSGFIAKEFLIFQTFKSGWLYSLTRVFWILSFIFTPFYMLMLNVSVSFNSKQSKLPQLTKLIRTPMINVNHIYDYLNSTLLISKLSLYIYYSLFIIVNITDMSLNAFNLVNLDLSFCYNIYNIEFINYNRLLTHSSLNALNTVVPLFTLLSLRYLRSIISK